MPQPFNDIEMSKFQNMSIDEMFKKAAPKPFVNTEVNSARKIAELAHFLVHNYKEELSSEEHVIDTAIRLLKK